MPSIRNLNARTESAVYKTVRLRGGGFEAFGCRADSAETRTELFYLPGAEAGSLTLGVVLCVQRAGDRLLTRPVFLPADAMDDAFHYLPGDAWAMF
ncbi:hypothetical protein [Kitasatospora sp. NPDC092286]|uniref:hypothetical protein n=1 Tax=Kitasatospora sp. NPDC092286 TaxID=3364087 RepID=UPI00381AC6E1